MPKLKRIPTLHVTCFFLLAAFVFNFLQMAMNYLHLFYYFKSYSHLTSNAEIWEQVFLPSSSAWYCILAYFCISAFPVLLSLFFLFRRSDFAKRILAFLSLSFAIFLCYVVIRLFVPYREIYIKAQKPHLYMFWRKLQPYFSPGNQGAMWFVIIFLLLFFFFLFSKHSPQKIEQIYARFLPLLFVVYLLWTLFGSNLILHSSSYRELPENAAFLGVPYCSLLPYLLRSINYLSVPLFEPEAISTGWWTYFLSSLFGFLSCLFVLIGTGISATAYLKPRRRLILPCVISFTALSSLTLYLIPLFTGYPRKRVSYPAEIKYDVLTDTNTIYSMVGYLLLAAFVWLLYLVWKKRKSQTLLSIFILILFITQLTGNFILIFAPRNNTFQNLLNTPLGLIPGIDLLSLARFMPLNLNSFFTAYLWGSARAYEFLAWTVPMIKFLIGSLLLTAETVYLTVSAFSFIKKRLIKNSSSHLKEAIDETAKLQ